MDVLVVVGDDPPPERALARARHVVRVPPGEAAPDLLAELRTRIPREIGVVGAEVDAEALAADLHRHGFPVLVVRESDSGPRMEVASSLLDLVGNTPLVRLDRIARDLSCQVVAKLELLNPGGSVKDRPAVAMIDEAERTGRLKPGGTIVEPPSGNTGVGLAIVAARRRYRCIFVMPDKMSAEKIALLRAYGADVVVCPTAVAPEHPESYYSVAHRLVAE